MMPRMTVAPARPRSRALSTSHSYSGLPSCLSSSPTKRRSRQPSWGRTTGLPPEKGRDHPAAPDGCQADRDPESHVRERENQGAVAKRVHALVGERRKGREAPEQPDDEERAGLRRHEPTHLRKLRERADCEATERVDEEGPDGE